MPPFIGGLNSGLHILFLNVKSGILRWEYKPLVFLMAFSYLHVSILCAHSFPPPSVPTPPFVSPASLQRVPFLLLDGPPLCIHVIGIWCPFLDPLEFRRESLWNALLWKSSSEWEWVAHTYQCMESWTGARTGSLGLQNQAEERKGSIRENTHDQFKPGKAFFICLYSVQTADSREPQSLSTTLEVWKTWVLVQFQRRTSPRT